MLNLFIPPKKVFLYLTEVGQFSVFKFQEFWLVILFLSQQINSSYFISYFSLSASIYSRDHESSENNKVKKWLFFLWNVILIDALPWLLEKIIQHFRRLIHKIYEALKKKSSQNKRSIKNHQLKWTDSSQKKFKWPVNTRKTIHHLWPLDRCKSKH